MSLTEEQRRTKLLECETGKDFHSLYELVFGEEVPETETRNPNEELDMILKHCFDFNPPPPGTLPLDYPSAN